MRWPSSNAPSRLSERVENSTDYVATSGNRWQNRGMLTALALALAFQTPDNTLTVEEIHSGWKLMFDGKTTKGWHNFTQKSISDGWQVKDGVLTIVDASKAGDIVSDEQYDWFEMSIDVNIGKGQNSGIMFRVLDSGEAPWHSGPEVQIYDHAQQEGVETTGYLYQLYKPATGVDAAKPAGEWNRIRIVVAPTGCATYVNDTKYYEYKLGSEDFWARVKKSKFNQFPQFAKADKGHIAIQGDHGLVKFRNIKIRPIKP